MELAFVVYLISILENIGRLLVGIATMSGIGVFFLSFFSYLENGTVKNKKTVITLVILCLTFSFLRAMLPSEKQAYTIAAAYAGQQIYQSDEAKQIGNKLMKVINQKLDGMAEDTKGIAKEKNK